MFNAEKWLDQAFDSLLHQNFSGSFEVSIYNDASVVLASRQILVHNNSDIFLPAGFYSRLAESMDAKV